MIDLKQGHFCGDREQLREPIEQFPVLYFRYSPAQIKHDPQFHLETQPNFKMNVTYIWFQFWKVKNVSNDVLGCMII